MTLTAIIQLLRTYWRPILLIAACAFLFLWGYRSGSNEVQGDWDKAVVRQNLAAMSEKDRINQEAARLSSQYQLAAAKSRAALETTNRRLKDALLKNSALRDCVADDDFVRIYEAVGIY